MGWVGLSSIRYDSLPKSIALVNISCNHEYCRSLLYLELYSVHHNVFSGFVCPSPAKKARRDPFDDTRDGNPTNEHEPTNHMQSSIRSLSAGIFWKENDREFPLLAKVDRRILCPVRERLFSGQTYHC